MVIKFVLLIVGAYLLGSVPAAYLAAKLTRGIDLRQYGSGNIGVGNLLKFTSKRLVTPVIIFDLGKGIVMVWAAQLVGLDMAQQITVGVAAIIGHNWPVFLRFNGGRGVLTTLGVALGLPIMNNLVPWGMVGFLTTAGVGIYIIHNAALGINTGVAVMPLVSWWVNEPLPITLGLLAMFLIGVIRRLTVPRTALVESVSDRQLILNRLLFDRDIGDREAWVHRIPPKATLTEQQEKQGEGQP